MNFVGKAIIFIIIVGTIAATSYLIYNASIQPLKEYTLIITDEMTSDDLNHFQARVQTLIPDYSAKLVFSNETEISKLIKQVPAAYFDKSVNRSKYFKEIKSMLVEVDGGYIFPANYFQKQYFINADAKKQYLFETYSDNMKVLGVNYTSMFDKPQIDYFIYPLNSKSEDIDLEMARLSLATPYFLNQIQVYPRFIIRFGNDSDRCESLSCARTPLELNETARRLCAYYTGGLRAYYAYSLSMDKINKIINNDSISYTSLEDFWKKFTENLTLADANAGFNVTNLMQCYNNLRRGILIDERNVASGVLNITEPTIFINGREYAGPIYAVNIGLKICEEYWGEKAIECKKELYSNYTSSEHII
jgi:hypothetical protein